MKKTVPIENTSFKCIFNLNEKLQKSNNDVTFFKKGVLKVTKM